MADRGTEQRPKTTGHVWDGIEELDNPVPRLLTWAYVAAILWAVGIWALFPSWPWIDRTWAGLLEYSSQQEATQAYDALVARRGQKAADLLGREEIMAAGASLFADNCAACHGPQMRGQPGFPDLADDHWLWSGTPEEIALTIRFGINTDHPETRYSDMPAFGADGLLSDAEIAALADYVHGLTTAQTDPGGAAAQLFAETCGGCHGAQGQGGLGTGAPALNDAAWLYGGEIAAIRQSIYGGRSGVMPDWDGRLSDHQIDLLATYLRVVRNETQN